MRYRLVHPAELDERLVDSWRELHARHEAFSSPYFAPEFALSVAAVRRDVRITLIEADGAPAGFFPHQRSAFGIGRPVGGPLSDFHGVIASPGCDWQAEDLLRASRLAVWSFDHLAGDRRPWERYIVGAAESPRIDLRGGYEGYVAQRRSAGSDYIPKTEGLARKLAREHGETTFAMDDLQPDALEHLFRWKSAQYRQSGTQDVFAFAWTRTLIRHLVENRSKDFGGMCSTLRIAGNVVAVHFGMRSARVLHYWFPAYDPAYSKYSVGIVLLLRLAAAAAALGIEFIDLGKGDTQYKSRLMNSSIQVHEGCASIPSWPATAQSVRRSMEKLAAGGGVWSPLRLPLKVLRRLDRSRRFR